MMKLGRRCSLCGGRLDSSLRCTECGLDNTKNDSMYKNMVNKNDCEDQPLTHVHEHKEKSYGYDYQNKKGTRKTTVKSYPKSAKNLNLQGVVGAMIAIVVVFSTVIPTLFDTIDFYEDDYFYEEEYDGAYYEWFLDNGFYEVGVHLPAGAYNVCIPAGEYASVDIYEFDGQDLVLRDFIEFGGYEGWEQEADFEEGQYIVISTWSTVVFGTYNDYEYAYDNIVLVEDEECHEANGTMIAGVDFPAGVYDISFYDAYGSGNVLLDLMSADGENFVWSDDVHFDDDNGIVFYQGFPFTPGSMITVEDGVYGVMLEPTCEIGQDMYDITWGAEE